MSDGLRSLDDDILLSMVLDEDELDTFIDSIGDESYEESLINEIAKEKLINSIDTKTGAPANVRAQVGAAQKPNDKLETLKKFYPDAIPVEILDPQSGASKFGRGNFVFTNPETNKPTLFDEDLRLFGIPVPGLRDLVDVGPEIAETIGAVVGGTGGGIAGAPAGPAGPAIGFAIGEGIGSATAREAYIDILNFFGETEDNRTGIERLYDFGTTAIVNSTGGPLTNKLLDGIKYVAGQPIRFVTGAMSKEAKIAKDKMLSVGVTNPSAGQVTANPVLNLAEQALAAAPASTKILQENAAQTVKQIDNFAKDLAQKYGGIRTTAEASEKLVTGAQRARLDYDNKINKMYNEVNNFMPETLVSDGKNTIEFVEKYLARSKTATGKPELNPALRQAEMLLKDAKNGVLTYNNLKDFRSSLMFNLRSAESRGSLSAPNRKIKELVGFITKDLDALVKLSDDPRALKKYKAANAFYAKNKGKQGGMTYIDDIIKKGEVRATDALKYVLRGSKDGGEDLLKLRKELKKDEYNVISGYILGRMGLPTPGLASAAELGQEAAKKGSEYISEQGFSPKRFITNWNQLSKEAKEALFKGTEHEELVPALDNLVFTIDRIGKSADQMANPSGTARVAFAMGTLGVLGADVGLGRLFGSEGFEYGLGALIAPYYSAKLLTNKSFVNWLAEGVEKAAYDPKSWGQHARRLFQIYELNPDIREEVRAVANGLTGETLEPTDWESSKSALPISKSNENEQKFREVSGEEVSNKLIPTNLDLENRIREFEVSKINSSPMTTPVTSTDIFEDDLSGQPMAQLGINPATSPTILPSEIDREIAMRMQMQDRKGITGLG
tara:strand:+ start:682 stop:3201 length:2520 start_codon:yes stop_codon:yes gene_type:complete